MNDIKEMYFVMESPKSVPLAIFRDKSDASNWAEEWMDRNEKPLKIEAYNLEFEA